MSKIRNVRGICASCKFGPECPLHHGTPVLQCGQFVACDYAPHRSVHSPEPMHEVTDAGLCARCEVEGDCTLSRPESGVWYCEAFRN